MYEYFNPKRKFECPFYLQGTDFSTGNFSDRWIIISFLEAFDGHDKTSVTVEAAKDISVGAISDADNVVKASNTIRRLFIGAWDQGFPLTAKGKYALTNNHFYESVDPIIFQFAYLRWECLVMDFTWPL